MIAYLDASATVKLLRPEPETRALMDAVAQSTGCVSSEVLEVELCCVARRLGGGPLLRRARAILAGIDLVPFSHAVRARATAAFSPPQRALDAIHLASALDLGLAGVVLLTYDVAQAAAAQHAGLAALGPA